jgi:hypothetical protein
LSKSDFLRIVCAEGEGRGTDRGNRIEDRGKGKDRSHPSSPLATPWQGGQPSTQSYAEPGRSEDRGQWEAEQDLLTIAEETGLEVAKWYQKAGELIS